MTNSELRTIPPAVEVVYREVCASYHRIDDFRAKLLGLLPLASGAGLFWLLSYGTKTEPSYMPAVGIFGVLVTVALFFYELRGVQRCIRLSEVGKELECSLGVKGQFSRWPHSVGRFVNEPIAASIIYPAVAGGWAYAALVKTPTVAVLAAATLFIVGFLLGWRFYLHVRPNKRLQQPASSAGRT